MSSKTINPYLPLLLILVVSSPIAMAQMGFRQEPLYEEGGFTNPEDGNFALIFAFVFWGAVVWFFVRQLGNQHEEPKVDSTNHNREKNRTIELNKTATTRSHRSVITSDLRNTTCLEAALRRSPSILFIQMCPLMITQALDRVQTDLDASFYIIGHLEKPIVAWFKFGIAADFSSSPIKLSELREVFGYHKDLLGGGEDQVSFEVFAQRVNNIGS